jgi:NAD(P)H dehydrogenase (quinone)
MSSILVVYYSRTGHTQEMAEHIANGVKNAGGEATLKSVEEVTVEELAAYDGLVIGSPSYYGGMAAEVKRLLDQSVGVQGKLTGKVGGAFCSSARLSGGNETTVLSILNGLMIHGMVVTGGTMQFPYGPVAIHAPDDTTTQKECMAYGRRLAELADQLKK